MLRQLILTCSEMFMGIVQVQKTDALLECLAETYDEVLNYDQSLG